MGAKPKAKAKSSASKTKTSKKKIEEVKVNLIEEIIIEFTIPKELKMPKLRWIPDPITMKRLVMRYVSFKDDFKGFGTRADLKTISGLM